MAGPTPVSALIHAATMVAAGIYFVARLYPSSRSPTPRCIVLAVMAARHHVWAALLALAQDDIKRVLAYSTISQLGYMAGALAVGRADGAAPALFHLLSHARSRRCSSSPPAAVIHAAGTTFVALRGRRSGAVAPVLVDDRRPRRAGRAAAVRRLLLQGGRPRRRRGVAERPDAGLVVRPRRAGLTAGSPPPTATRVWLLLTTEREGGLVELEAEEGQDESSEEAAPAGDEGRRPGKSAREARPVTMAAALTVSALAVLDRTSADCCSIPVSNGIHLGLVMTGGLPLVIGLAFLGVRAMATAGHDPARRLGPAVADLRDRGFGFDAVYVAAGRAVIAVARLVVRLDRDVVDAYPRGAASLTGIAGRLGEKAHRAAPSAGLLAVVIGVVLIAVAGVTVWH